MQMENDSVGIEFSKWKILLRTLGCFVFVVLGIYLWSIAGVLTHYPPLYVKIVSILSISFFGIGCIVLPYKLFGNSLGLIIDNYGIHFAAGVNKSRLIIEWRSITGFQIKEIKRTKILLIFINNAEAIINSESMWQQKLMRLGLKMYGTPISISTGTYKCSFDDLVKTITEKWKEQKVK
jgi:hypothetical protein